IDRCIVDPSARIQHYLDGNIEKYESLWRTDVLIPQGYVVYSAFIRNPQWKCVFITSRREWARQSTAATLLKIWPDAEFDLLMRPNDVTKEIKDDAEIKPWLLAEAGYSVKEVFLAFDDRDSVVNEWRRLGVTCYQTDRDIGH
ncbi:MAG: hypothetical protein WC954_05950, partial [Sphaerochaeta sp.]